MRICRRLWAMLPRPLDPLRSIKIKLGVVAMFTACVGVFVLYLGYRLGIEGQYTAPVGALISLAVIQLLAHGMTEPLRQMTAAARVMARGDYSRRVRTNARDEVGELAQAFNRMAEDLAEVDRQRREFVANVSHELRTPISALRAVLENVADGVTAPTPKIIGEAVEQTERLGRLVTQLLDLSRVDAGAGALDRVSFDIGPFVSSVVAEVAPGYPGTAIRTDVPPALYAVADRDRLYQVLSNLLDNAARHSPPGGAVTVTARPGIDVGGLVLEVADEGPGIPPAERARVFERFSRGSYAATPSGRGRPVVAGRSGEAGRTPAHDGGTGLGLAIARWAVDLHRGEIGVVDSERGCRIRVVIPGSPP